MKKDHKKVIARSIKVDLSLHYLALFSTQAKGRIISEEFYLIFSVLILKKPTIFFTDFCPSTNLMLFNTISSFLDLIPFRG